LSSLLADEPEVEVVGHATRGDQALAKVAEQAPDVVIFTPELPDIGGLALVEKLNKSSSTVRAVMLAPQISDKQFLEARQSGVRGVLLTTMPVRLIVQCIKTVHAGEEFVEKETFIKALTLLIRRQNDQGPTHDGLTEREKEVAELVAAGRRLKVGTGTVKSHLHSVYDKLGVHSRYALMRFAAAKKP
jgi:DNA-binding NarL/FixJ family response regulator